MSSFNCEHCNAAITENADGVYTTECEHYPLKLELANERRAHRCTKFRLKEAENTILGYKVAEVRCQCGHRYVAHYYEPGPHIACTECDSTKCCADPKSGCDADATVRNIRNGV